MSLRSTQIKLTRCQCGIQCVEKIRSKIEFKCLGVTYMRGLAHRDVVVLRRR